MAALDSLYRRNALHWDYHNRETQLGATATLIPFGDQEIFGKVNATTGTGMRFNASGLAPTWTHSEAMSAWDTAFDLTDPDNWQGVIPVLTFNGTDEESDTPDAAGWSTAGAFSWVAWIYLNTLASNVILAKWDETTSAEAREFIAEVDANGDIGFRIYDETNNAAVGRKQDTALVAGRWYHVAGTFDGGTDAAGVSIYVNGVATDDADIVDDAGFANAVDTATVVSLGYSESTAGAKQNFFDGKMAGGPCCVGFCTAELTAAQVLNMFRKERRMLGL